MSRTYPLVDMTPHWQGVQDEIVRMAGLIPRDKLNWTPKEDLWNFRGILIHIADARDQWMSRDVDKEAYPGIWSTVRSQEDITRELERTWERLQRFLSNQAQLDAKYGDDNPDREEYDGHWIAFHLLEHDVHHRAELMQRMALLGIPHGSDL